jgi:hypothetical protein
MGHSLFKSQKTAATKSMITAPMRIFITISLSKLGAKSVTVFHKPKMVSWMVLTIVSNFFSLSCQLIPYSVLAYFSWGGHDKRSNNISPLREGTARLSMQTAMANKPPTKTKPTLKEKEASIVFTFSLKISSLATLYIADHNPFTF